MGKIHEALKKAEKEKNKNYLEPKREWKKNLPLVPQKEIFHPAPEWFKELKTRLHTQYSDDHLKVILFSGVSEGNGCTSTTVGFAASLAKSYNQNVVLMDINLKTPGLDKIFDNNLHLLADILPNTGHIRGNKQREKGNLYVIGCSNSNSDEISSFLHSDRFDQFLEKMRSKFDYILVDAAPVLVASETLVVGKKVDGVVLVVEQGLSRKNVAKKAKDKFEEAGAKILGIVINKRRYYIPKWIYKRI